jgi:hypothetical protein
MVPSKYSAQAIFQPHFNEKNCILYWIKYGSQLPVYATRWHHDMFCILYLLKITTFLLTQQILKPEINKHRFGICRIIQFFEACYARLSVKKIFLLSKIGHWFLVTIRLFTSKNFVLDILILVIKSLILTLF